MPKDKKRLSYVTAKPREDSLEDVEARSFLFNNPGAGYVREGLPENEVAAMNRRDIGRMRDAEELIYQLREAARRSGIYRPEMERAPKPQPKPEMDIEFGEPVMEAVAQRRAPVSDREAYVRAKPRELSVDEAALKRSVLDVAGGPMTPAERQFVMQGTAALPTSRVRAMDRAAGVPALQDSGNAGGGLTPQEQTQLEYLLSKARGIK